MSKFLTTEMSPRALRLLAYSCIGFLIYGFILLSEILQNFQLNRIDHQLKMLEREVDIGKIE